ncbi:MAG: PEP/pyruvate-binding domain-containing protein [Eubacteriales bacterium]|nr:PEP/pyruvate-binding domain-containing protein [Eubacteriales bacterium]
MAAFDKIECGLSGVDEALDYIRLGDNVVWQVNDIREFKYFAERFARQAVKDQRNVIYIRFAQHEPVLEDLTGIKVCKFNPDEGFESFTVKIHEEITRQGRDAFYVFDCLSELQSVWYTDLMMGNFFRVTCPYLFELDTVAYFPVLRGRHSFDAMKRIRDTTQLLLDVYSGDRYLYLHPLKVWKRTSEKMFLPHQCEKETGEVHFVENGVDFNRYYQIIQKFKEKSEDQKIDSYDRFFNTAKLKHSMGIFSENDENQIIDSTMTKDPRLKTLVKRYFKPEDYFALRDRMVGSGAIGGKACGMLLSRKISETEIPEFAEHSEAHDSFYIGSDVFYTYIVANGNWNLRIKQRTEEGYFAYAGELKEKLETGIFPDNIKEQFLNILEYYGQSCFIVRSSSFLEDGFGNAFAGKYESVFCVNRGNPEERLEAFMQAVRTVYASTMDYSALEYRRRRGLDKLDEQMAILVQRVSGSYYGDFYMPGAAGVGYSHSAYKMFKEMDPEAGMLRLVIGLGTKAVDRTKEDYPRLCSLDRPAATIYTTTEQKHKYSQRYIDVLDCRQNKYREIHMTQLLEVFPDWYKRMVLEHDMDAEYRLRESGLRKDVWFVSCQKLLETKEFTDLMQKILKTLDAVYENPVDIEYAINMDKTGDFVVNLLQCRPLYIGKEGEKASPKIFEPDSIFMELKESSMGYSGKTPIDVVIQIDPVLYYNYPYAKKYDVAAAVGKINRYYANSNKHIMLLSPGRIGTSSPELGVPVAFGDISNFSEICELSDSRAGYMPELSYGSHMFQDLVEAEIRYHAVYNNAKTIRYNEEYLKEEKDIYLDICGETYPQFESMIRVYEVENLYSWLDAVKNHMICGKKK